MQPKRFAKIENRILFLYFSFLYYLSVYAKIKYPSFIIIANKNPIYHRFKYNKFICM